MSAPDPNDEFLHRLRVRPEPRFASGLKVKLDQSSTAWERSMSSYIQAWVPVSRRSFALVAIFGLHAAFIFAFANGLMQRIARDTIVPIKAVFPELERPVAEAPKTVVPVLKDFTIPVPKPVAPIEEATDTLLGQVTEENIAPAYSGMVARSPGGAFVRAGIGKNFPNPDSFYPPSAVRQEVEGRALVRVCVGPDGRLSEAPQIVRSTQSRSLDEAAIRLAQAGNYVAGSRDGVAITDCFSFQTIFQLKGRR